MAELPAMPLWTDAYLADTTHLSTEEHGAYLLLMMAMWRSGGRLRLDHVFLARVVKATPKRWDRLWPALQGFFNEDAGHIAPGASALRDVDWGEHQSRRLDQGWRRIRAGLLAQRAECAYCGSLTGPFEVDHIKPRALGGTNALSNLAVSCRTCNRSKGARTAVEWLGAKA